MTFSLYLAFIVLSFLRPVEAYFPELQVYRPMVVLGLSVLALAIIEAIFRRSVSARPRYFWLMMGLLGCIALSKITNGWSGGAPLALADFSTSALLFLMTPLCVTSIARVRMTLVAVLLSIVTICAWDIVSYHTGYMADRLVLAQGAEDSGEAGGPQEAPSDIPAEDKSGKYLWRVRHLGFLSDPNDFGQVIVVALPMFALFYRPGRKLRNLLLIGPPAAILLYTIYLTHSRGAILGMAALLFVALRERLGSVRGTILVCVALGGILVTNVAGGRAFSASEDSAGGRILAWSEGLTMLRSRPVFGIGYADFTNHHEYTAHNSYVLCFAELGLVGYFIWLAMIIGAVGEVQRVASHEIPEGGEMEPDAKGSAAILRTSMAGFLTCAYFLSRTYAPPLYLLLGLCVVCAQLARDQDTTGDLDKPQKWVLQTSVVLIVSIFVVYLMVLFKHSSG